MKRIVLVLVLAACGGGSTDGDGGTDGSGSDVANSDGGGGSDGSSTDAPNDAVITLDGPFGDGSLGPNQPCDPQNNLCNKTLLCCSEPNHDPDAGVSTSYVCEPPDNTLQCPKLP